MLCIFKRKQGGWHQALADMSETRPLEEAELGVNDLSVCKGHGSKGTGMIGSGKTPLTPWQSLPRVICSLPLSSLLSWSLFSPCFLVCLSLLSSPSLSVSSFLSPLFTQDQSVSHFLSLSHPTSHPFSGCPSLSLLLHSLWAYHAFFVYLCLFFYPSISSPLSLSQSFSVVVAPLQCLKLQMIDKSP